MEEHDISDDQESSNQNAVVPEEPFRDDQPFSDETSPDEATTDDSSDEDPLWETPEFDLKTPTPERRPIVPTWIPIALLIGLSLVVLGSGIFAWMMVGARVEVPEVTELNEGLAEVRLSERGLETLISERRFSDVPEGTVIEQSPVAGTTVSKGDTVNLVVSAGSDETEMPDVVGQNVRVARARLESEGLLVKVDAQQSELPKDTVISTNPAPGATVRTGEIVRVTIAAEGSATDALLPYSMSGATFVIDPSTAPADSLDVPLDVSRRLQSLLEASGAKVVTTRSAADTGTDEASRATKVPATGMTAIIGLDVSSSGNGMAVLTQTEAAAGDTYKTSAALGDELQAALKTAGYSVTRSEINRDAVLSATQAAGARVKLGSTTSDEDLALFRDPAWADAVARAIYQGLGERFGSR